MSVKSNIQWTDATWNIAVGCTKVDEDCKYCYMYRDSFDGKRYDPRIIRKTKTVFDMPLKYKNKYSECWGGKPLIFTSSLTDFFHEECDPYREEAWDIIRKCPHLIFQILTKRPERIKDHLPADWGDEGYENVWLGTSIGNQSSQQRIIDLVKSCDAKVKFLSIEPLHGKVDLGNIKITFDFINDTSFYVLPAIDWVIVGGESGNDNGKYKYRPCEVEWIEEIVFKCKDNNIPVFVKQMGTYLSKQLGMSDRHGGNIDEFPLKLRVRQFPYIKY